MTDVPADPTPAPLRAVPADLPPSELPASDAGAEPADEGARQTLDTLRSISRLEESNDQPPRP